MKNLAFVLEMIWLLVAVLCFGAAIQIIIKRSFAESYWFLGFAAISVFMYLMRRNRRLNG